MENMKLLEARQNEIVEEFSMFGDWMEKYEHIIEMGKELNPLAESDKTEDNLIRGCQSRVWLAARKDEDGNVHFSADSDAIITKGLVALMVRVLSDAEPEDIAKVDLHFLEDIGLNTHLSLTRSNGLASMVKQMKMYGLVFSARS
jgi:cysteine desulfuration protein SufE